MTAPPAAQNVSLTTAINNVTTGAGNDTFSGTAATLTAGDILDGGEGSDTIALAATIGANAAINGFTTSNIENISVNLVSTNAGAHTLTTNMINSAPANITVSGTTVSTANDVASFTNVDGGTSLTFSGNDAAATVAYKATWLAGTGDSATLQFLARLPQLRLITISRIPVVLALRIGRQFNRLGKHARRACRVVQN